MLEMNDRFVAACVSSQAEWNDSAAELFLFFYLLHGAAISFLPKPTAQFSGAVQPSDSYQTVYLEQCDLLNCSR